MNPNRQRINDFLEREVVQSNFAHARRIEGSDIDWLNIPDSAKPDRKRRQGGFLPHIYRRRGYIMAVTPQQFMDWLPEWEGSMCMDNHSSEISKRWHNHEYWSPFMLMMRQTKSGNWRVTSGSPFAYHSARFMLRRGIEWVRVQLIPEDDSQSTKEVMAHIKEYGLIPKDADHPIHPVEHISITL
jgi:hypothetical protein